MIETKFDAAWMLNAAADGELDAMSLASFERHCAGDPALAARYAQMRALRGAMRGASANLRAPDDLRARIAAMAAGESAAPQSDSVAAMRRRPRFPMAAAVALSLAAGGIAERLFSDFVSAKADRVAMLIIDDHRRAMLASSPIDVASDDRHTVKPWFDAKLALSPPVVDLAAKGYALAGGRADVVDGAAVPSLVYRLREHFISVTALPAARFSGIAARAEANGYAATAWRDGAFEYVAVSDLPRSDLEAFAAAFRAGAEAGEAR